jgi:hypothetical protein
MLNLNKDYPMPRKTLALIIGLVAVTIILFIIALNAGRQPVTNQRTKLDWCTSNNGTVLYSERSGDYYCTIDLQDGK